MCACSKFDKYFTGVNNVYLVDQLCYVWVEDLKSITLYGTDLDKFWVSLTVMGSIQCLIGCALIKKKLIVYSYMK